MENLILERKKMTPNAYRIYNYLCDVHVGRENAIKMAELSSLMQMSTRELRALVSEINNYPANVKVICSGNVGVWIANNEDEVLEATTIYKKKALSLLTSYSNMMKKLGKHSQLKITFTDNEKPVVEAFSQFSKDDLKAIKTNLSV